MLVKPVQSSKVELPIEVSPSGKVMLVKWLQYLNAESPMEVTPLGITKLPLSKSLLATRKSMVPSPDNLISTSPASNRLHAYQSSKKTANKVSMINAGHCIYNKQKINIIGFETLSYSPLIEENNTGDFCYASYRWSPVNLKLSYAFVYYSR
jgi:hypothetical protein